MAIDFSLPTKISPLVLRKMPKGTLWIENCPTFYVKTPNLRKFLKMPFSSGIPILTDTKPAIRRKRQLPSWIFPKLICWRIRKLNNLSHYLSIIFLFSIYQAYFVVCNCIISQASLSISVIYILLVLTRHS